MKKYLTLDVLAPTLVSIFLICMLIGLIKGGLASFEIDEKEIGAWVFTWVLLILVFGLGLPLAITMSIMNIKNAYKNG